MQVITTTFNKVPIVLVPSLFEYLLSDAIVFDNTVSKNRAEQLFSFFKEQPLFNWKQTHNGCEARADAVCVLLDTWQIPNCKVWVFSGEYLKKHIGGLNKNWNYHVAPVLPVNENGKVVLYVLDPATADALQTIDNWAAGVTQYPHSYHLTKYSHWYIFPQKNITAFNWHTRNKQNRKWMLQGLAGIYGLSASGKASLCFNKIKLKNTARAFEQLKREQPF